MKHIKRMRDSFIQHSEPTVETPTDSKETIKEEEAMFNNVEMVEIESDGDTTDDEDASPTKPLSPTRFSEKKSHLAKQPSIQLGDVDDDDLLRLSNHVIQSPSNKRDTKPQEYEEDIPSATTLSEGENILINLGEESPPLKSSLKKSSYDEEDYDIATVSRATSKKRANFRKNQFRDSIKLS
eukprot:CAMPEP_0117426448 /NCGR_PEP_ID=MMETSP0758-20121206/6562_1 /TAXON_ID=63605 /ORGANISM="Percolomonas cosmopolitus, Strain AE-1 (ATCC 50343)" /LENGTH=181 /DNA_ID=CAMNT_0005211627 /DNA_START=610 /DNA_END=1152 /DNA_ORIENTATION=-